ncbi:hypothetical protein [Janthinobacterium sp. ZB1P44]|uniref:hypothetical protein n=1 Tax=Janthinobacterium sp. ZB1P44 TaxID=3424192 RepID=UPI003F22CC2A
MTYPQSSQISPLLHIEPLAGVVPAQACWRFHFAKRFGSVVRVMPAVPVFVAQLLAGFFFSQRCLLACFFETSPASVLEGVRQAKRALSGLP